MPILKREDDIFPHNLLNDEPLLSNDERQWWCIYTISRREKDLMRKLLSWKIPFYGPVIPKRYRSPSGRLRTSFIPMFPNYVFLFGTKDEQYQAMTTNCVSKCTPIRNPEQLLKDLRQIYQVVMAGIPLTPEAQARAGRLCTGENRTICRLRRERDSPRGKDPALAVNPIPGTGRVDGNG